MLKSKGYRPIIFSKTQKCYNHTWTNEQTFRNEFINLKG